MPAKHPVAFSAGWGVLSQACGPGKVRRVRLNRRACSVVGFPWKVLSVRGEVEQAGLFTSKALPEEPTLEGEPSLVPMQRLPFLLNYCGEGFYLLVYWAEISGRNILCDSGSHKNANDLKVH